MGCGGSWGAKGGFFHTLEQKSSHCVLMEVQKGAQYTCQAEKVIGSSFTPSVALLVHPSGIIHPIITCHGSQSNKHDASKSRPCYVCV